MEKVLKLYTYIDGVNDTPFPNKDEQVITSDFRSDYKRMGGVPTISCAIMHPLCLDKLWTDNVYATFNGEKFFIKQIPTSSYDNTDARYKHELELVSERIILDNVYVYDVVASDTTNDKPVSNSSKFVFFGTIHEYAERLNRSLEYSGLDYRVVVDDGISSEGKMVSFENQFFSNAIQEAYNTYEIPYYFVGKVIHIGFTDNAITHTFKYGQDESLLSIQKQNANYKIVNRVTGVGSADNIPYYYPNDYESKEEVEANGGTWINPQTNLMPSIYRDTLGKERFYKALNNTYISPQTDTYYEFENPFIEGKPKEHIVNFDDIKPSIVGMVNANGYRIDMFQEFAYDLNDNDEFDEEGNYLHPYFFGKLRKFDGEYGFNLFDHAIDEDEMVISMTSGNCGACEFVIGVDEDTQKNPVQVNDSGNLKRDSDGNVITSGEFQDRQNDTQNYEVWIALKKDINTFGIIMPNATNNYRPSTSDTFVILHIDLPKAYILAAEDKLKEELIKYMAMNNSEKFNFSITFSRIFFAENPDILAQLNENARIQIEYDNELYELYVSSYSYNMSSDKPLPEIKVELSDTLTVTQNALQTAISEVKHDIMSSVGSIDWLQQGLRYFLRKDTNDRTKGKLSTDVAFEVGKYVSGASGAIIQVDKNTGQTVGELDKLYVRMKAYFETLEIINVNSVGGKQILSPAGAFVCLGVEETDDAYRCYYLGEQDGAVIENRWEIGDQAYSQMFNANTGVTNNVTNHYYWRLVVGVTKDIVEYEGKKCYYVDLSKTDCDSGSDVPKSGDIINQRGSRTELDRMNFIEQSSVDTFSPNITLFHGVNSYSLDDKEYVSFGVDKTTNEAYMNVYGRMYVGDRAGTSYMRYTQENGLEIKGKLSVGTTLQKTDGSEGTLEDLIAASTPEGYQEFVEKVTQDIAGLQSQIDGTIDSYFFQYDPSLTVYPASDWIKIDNENGNNNQKDAHLNDTFTNIASDSGRSWRWVKDTDTGNYFWSEITDTATTQALALAGKAQDTADGKRRVFVDTPYPPYDKGDLWSRGSDYPLLICVNPKKSTETYAESDFDYADNNAKLKEEMEDLVTTTKSELNNAIGQAKSEAITNANNYTDEGKKALQESIDAMNEAKANIADVYSKTEADGKISESEERALKAAEQEADTAIAYYDTIVKAYADGTATEEELAEIAGAKAALDAAKKYAEEKANEVQNEIKNSYLFKALTDAQDTTIDNGLVLTSLIQLRDTDGSIKSGINGLMNDSKGDKSIANWWGGIMEDMADYYTWDGTQWVAKSGVTVPSNLPKGLIRMDGTGYLANGKFWWDSDGKIYADPTALFLSFDVEAETRTLSATILNIMDKQTEFSNMWSLEEDSNGTKYLYSKYPLVSQGGVTMYAGTSGLDLPSIYDGLPIDGTTIYWENGILKAIGGGGTADAVAWDNITGKPTFATVATSGKYSDLSGTPTMSDYATTSHVDSITAALQGEVDGLWARNSFDELTVGHLAANTIAAESILNLATVATSGSYNDLSNKPTLLSSFTNDVGYLTSHQSIYTLTLKNSEGTTVLTYTPNSAASSFTLTKGLVGLYNVENTALSTWVGTNKITTLGTISTGTWQGTKIANAYLANSAISISGTSVSLGGSITQAALRTALGLGSNAYTSTAYLPFSSYTASDVLAKLITVDGSGSGLDADTLDGYQASVFYKGRGATKYNTGRFGGGTDTSWRRIFKYAFTSTTSSYASAQVHGRIYYEPGNHRQVQVQEIPFSAIFYAYSGTAGSAANRAYLYLPKFVNYDCIRIIQVDTNSWELQVRNPSAYTYITVEYEAANYDSYSSFDTSVSTSITDGTALLNYSNASARVDDASYTATKLQTARTIWGQSFDGTGNITGTLTLGNAVALNTVATTGVGYRSLHMSTSNNLQLGYDTAGAGYNTYINGNNIYFSYGTAHVTNMIINSSGNVGIGTTSPSYKLHVVGSLNATSIYQNGVLLDTTIDGYMAALQGQIDSLWNRDSYNSLYVEHLMSDTISSTFITSDTVNSVSIVGTGITAGSTTANNGTYSLYVTGSGYISSNLLTGGGITMYSSKKLKDIVDEKGLSLKELSSIKPIRFTWKDKRDDRIHIGGIAEDILKVLPEVIYRTSDDILTMDYGNAAFAIASSLIKPVISHEERIARLERENRKLKEEIKRLKTA